MSSIRSGGPDRRSDSEIQRTKKTYGRTNGESLSPTSETSSSVTRPRAYGFPLDSSDDDGICRCSHPLEWHERGECWTDLRTGGESWSPVEQCECRTAGPEPTWVCDGCMTRVTRDQIKDMADGEHVLCQVCWGHERHGQPCEHGSYVTQSDGDYCTSCHVKLPAASCR